MQASKVNRLFAKQFWEKPLREQLDLESRLLSTIANDEELTQTDADSASALRHRLYAQYLFTLLKTEGTKDVKNIANKISQETIACMQFFLYCAYTKANPNDFIATRFALAYQLGFPNSLRIVILSLLPNLQSLRTAQHLQQTFPDDDTYSQNQINNIVELLSTILQIARTIDLLKDVKDPDQDCIDEDSMHNTWTLKINAFCSKYFPKDAQTKVKEQLTHLVTTCCEATGTPMQCITPQVSFSAEQQENTKSEAFIHFILTKMQQNRTSALPSYKPLTDEEKPLLEEAKTILTNYQKHLKDSWWRQHKFGSGAGSNYSADTKSKAVQKALNNLRLDYNNLQEVYDELQAAQIDFNSRTHKKGVTSGLWKTDGAVVLQKLGAINEQLKSAAKGKGPAVSPRL